MTCQANGDEHWLLKLDKKVFELVNGAATSYKMTRSGLAFCHFYAHHLTAIEPATGRHGGQRWFRGMPKNDKLANITGWKDYSSEIRKIAAFLKYPKYAPTDEPLVKAIQSRA
jgi:hypothetical protein